MPKNKVPIDPMDGLPDAPFLVEGGMPIHVALDIWGQSNKPRHQHPEDDHAQLPGSSPHQTKD